MHPIIPTWMKDPPTGLLPGIGALLCFVAMGWTVVWGIQMQMAHTYAGQPPMDMMNYWLALGTISLVLFSTLVWAGRLSRPTASQVCVKRRPLLESEVQRLALRQLLRIETRL